MGTRTLTDLAVNINAFDTCGISVLGTGYYVATIAPGEEHLLSFQVSANYSTSVYLAVDGWQDGETFHWESPYVPVEVGQEATELVRLFAMTEPYPAIKEMTGLELLDWQNPRCSSL